MTTENTNRLVREARAARERGDRARAVELLGVAFSEADDEAAVASALAVTAASAPQKVPAAVLALRRRRPSRASGDSPTGRPGATWTRPVQGAEPRARRPLTADERRLASEYYHLLREVAGSSFHRFPRWFSQAERESAGAIGLMDAARTWTPDGGASFATHAKRRILGAILDAVREDDWVPRIVRKLQREGAVEPATMKPLGRKTAVDPRPVCAAELARIEAADEVRAALDRAQLEDRERALLGLRAEGLSLRAAGQALGVSESRACQLERRALDSVRWWHGLGADEAGRLRFGRGAP